MSRVLDYAGYLKDIPVSALQIASQDHQGQEAVQSIPYERLLYVSPRKLGLDVGELYIARVSLMPFVVSTSSKGSMLIFDKSESSTQLKVYALSAPSIPMPDAKRSNALVLDARMPLELEMPDDYLDRVVEHYRRNGETPQQTMLKNDFDSLVGYRELWAGRYFAIGTKLFDGH